MLLREIQDRKIMDNKEIKTIQTSANPANPLETTSTDFKNNSP